MTAGHISIQSLREYIGNKEFYRRTFMIALPIAAQSLITIGINMLDTIMLGELGETALSASALANQFIHIFQICSMGIGMGASVMVSRFFGKGDMDSLKKSVTIMLRLCCAFSAVFMFLTALWPSQIMRIFTDEQDVIEGGSSYFLWSVPTYLLLGISLDLAMVLRSVGKAKVPLLCSCVSFLANLFFNWVFIFGNLGAPKMEVAGAALGTFLARLIETGAILIYFFRREPTIRYHLCDIFAKCGTLLPEYIKICIPVLVSDTLLALGNSAVAVVMGHISSAFVAANSITSVTQQLTTVLNSGLFQAACIITGQTLGMGDTKRAQREGWSFLFFGSMTGLAGCIIILLIEGPVISMYNITSETAAIAHELMHSVALIMVFQSANSILTKGVLRGGGDTRFLMAADILFLWAASVPLGYCAGMVWHLDAFWIYFFLKIDQVIKCIWCVWRLHSGKWIKTICSAGSKNMTPAHA